MRNAGLVVAVTLILVLVWHFFSADVSIWVNDEHLSGPLAALAGGGISLATIILMAFMAALGLLLFAGIGLLLLLMMLVLVFPWLLPLCLPLMVILAVVCCIMLLASRKKKVGAVST